MDNMACVNAGSNFILHSKVLVLVRIPFAALCSSEPEYFVRLEVFPIYVESADITFVSCPSVFKDNLQRQLDKDAANASPHTMTELTTKMSKAANAFK